MPADDSQHRASRRGRRGLQRPLPLALVSLLSPAVSSPLLSSSLLSTNLVCSAMSPLFPMGPSTPPPPTLSYPFFSLSLSLSLPTCPVQISTSKCISLSLPSHPSLSRVVFPHSSPFGVLVFYRCLSMPMFSLSSIYHRPGLKWVPITHYSSEGGGGEEMRGER